MVEKVVRIEDLKEFVKMVENSGFDIVKEERERDSWGNYSVKMKLKKEGKSIKVLGTHNLEVKDVLILRSESEELLNSIKST